MRCVTLSGTSGGGGQVAPAGSLPVFSSSDFPSADALAGMGDLVNDFPVAQINAALQ